MKYLLDTCTVIWFDNEPDKLSPAVNNILMSSANEVMLSAAGVWELVIKVSTGKLKVSGSVQDLVARQQANHLRLLSITLDHLFRVPTLPTPHRDPFDRLLVAQALVEGAAVLTPDPLICQYPVPTVW